MEILPFDHKIIKFLFRNLYLRHIVPKSVDEDQKRKEFILTVILIGSITMLSMLDIIVLYSSILYGKSYTGVSFLWFSSIVGIFVFLFVLARLGHTKVASYRLIGIFTLSNSYAVYRWGINLPSSLLSYALIIVISGILVNTRFALFMTAGLITLTIGSGYLQSVHILNPNLTWRHQDPYVVDSVKYGILFFLMMILSWLSNREIEKSLDRARKSERLLILERDNLEIKVEERTRDLKYAQMEKMGQLYRFAEFGKLSSGLFHDLLSPLTSVCLTISKLEKIADTQVSDTKFYLDRALNASKKMESFALSVRKQLHTEEVKREFDPKEEIRDAVNLLLFKAREQNITISIHSNPPGSVNGNDAHAERRLFGNPLKFNQVIINLVSNAIDSFDSLEGTSVTSDTDGIGNKKCIKIHYNWDRNVFTMVIQDNGVGIPDILIEKIFEPFFTTKAINKGTGLGLSTTRAIIENDFNGTIAVSSSLGHGTVFKIEIPA